MFNQDSNIKGISLIQGKLYQDNDILVSQVFVKALSNYHNEIKMQGQMDYQNAVTTYINKKHEYSAKKQYNPKIVNLYKNGLLVVNGEEYPLKELFIVFDDEKNNFHLKSKYESLNKDNSDYNKAIKLIDTTAFINLINTDGVTTNNNKLILNNIELLHNAIINWNGYLHSEIEETDVIPNKRMIKGDDNE